MSLTLPLPVQRSHGRTGTIRATVEKFGVGLQPMTAEVITEYGDQLTVWNLGYTKGQAVELERRGTGEAAYWADVNDAGGPRR